MAKITTAKTHTSGIALGGIGAGSVELLPDGELHYWQIANVPRFAHSSNEKKVDDGEGSTGALSFWVREKRKNQRPVIRKLGMKTEAEDFSYRMFAWNKPVEKIDFDGRFPLCDLDYTDSALSCRVSLRAASPFVPHNSDVSSTPGFYMNFTVENPTDEVLEISLAGALEPNFANKKEGNRNTLHTIGNGYGVHIEPEKKSDSPCCGDVCLSVSGDGEKTYITADYFRFMKEYIGSSAFGVTQESFLFSFRDKGELPNSKAGKRPGFVPLNFLLMGNAQLEALCNKYLQYPFGANLLERIKHCRPDFLSTREDRIAFLKCCLRYMLKIGKDFGSCALCSKLMLQPGERKTVRFVFSWYFPNFSPDGRNKQGHYYENLYSSSLEANRFLVDNSDSVYGKAVSFAELLYCSDLPSVYPDAWSSNLSQLIKSSHYLRNGRFGLWEGLGFCGFHTTDITYHASFGLVSLFPDLQKKQMKMGAEFQRKDGRVHHLFRPGLEEVDKSFDRVDMNMQFVLMVLRDYLFTGDREHLLSLWENVKKAMDSIEKLDTDGDGLPDCDTKRNTYDAWNFSGVSAYISVLWLAALKAAVVMAERVGDSVRYEKYCCLLAKGSKSLDNKLWNGEYYNLWVDTYKTDEALMTAQLDGEWFLRMAGLDGNVTDDKVRKTVEVIFSNNFDNEQGLINATVPEGRKTSINTYKNCQADAVWTGIGYAFSALCLAVGKSDFAETVVDSIHRNQMSFGCFWDHWECGHHYTRPMSAWSTLIAAAGMRIDYENKRLTLRPVSKNITFPIVIPGVLAKAVFTDGKLNLECLEGSLSDWNIVTE